MEDVLQTRTSVGVDAVLVNRVCSAASMRTATTGWRESRRLDRTRGGVSRALEEPLDQVEDVSACRGGKATLVLDG